MANAWTKVDSIATEALIHLEDALVITNLTAKDKTAAFNRTADGYAKGDTVRIKTRPDYKTDEFDGTIEVQSIRESTREMKIEKHFDISVQMTAKEKALDLDSLIEQVIAPAVHRIAESCDRYVGTKFLQGAGMYASDDLFGTAADVALARKAANYQQLDPGSRFCIVDDILEAKLLGKDWMNRNDSRSETGVSVMTSGRIARTMGMEFHASLNFPLFSRTSSSGTTATNNGNGGNTNNQIGMKVLTVDGITGGFTAGDRIRVAGVRRPLIVAANAAADATSITLVDPISEVIPDDAAVTVIGAGQAVTAHGAIFDGQALAVAMPVLDAPADKPSFVASSNGYSIRVVQGYDMNTKTDTLSLDLLMGAVAYDPRRITLLTEH